MFQRKGVQWSLSMMQLVFWKGRYVECPLKWMYYTPVSCLPHRQNMSEASVHFADWRPDYTAIDQVCNSSKFLILAVCHVHRKNLILLTCGSRRICITEWNYMRICLRMMVLKMQAHYAGASICSEDLGGDMTRLWDRGAGARSVPARAKGARGRVHARGISLPLRGSGAYP